MQANIEQSGTNTRINGTARRISNNRSWRVRRLAALAGLLGVSAVLRPSPIHGQSPLTPIWLVLPIAYIEASDWGSAQGPVVAYDDWSDDVFNPLVEARAEAGGAVGEAVIGLGEWAKASAGPNSQAQSRYYVEIDVADPQDRPSVKTIVDFKGAVSGTPNGGGAVWMFLGANNGVAPIAWVRDDLTLAGVDLPSVVAPGAFRMQMQTGQDNQPDGSIKQYVVSQIFLNGVPANVKSCWCSGMSDGGSLNLTFKPGRYLLMVVAYASATTGRGLAVGDPILRAHPDNPDIVVTRRAPVGAIDSPLSDTTPEELAALGLDPTPFSEMGFFDPPSDPPDDPPSDTTAPATSAGTTTLPNANGWHRSSVTVNLSATDNPEGTGVKEIHVALTGASSGVQVVPGGSATAAILAEGETTLTYYAVDHAGNQEAPKTLTVKIDATPPTLAGLPTSGCSIWPPDHRLVAIANVSASDALSGLASGAPPVSATSNEPATGLGSGDVAPDVVITNNLVEVRAERAATGSGRVYTVTASASDLAGNQVTASATCTVPRDVKMQSN